MTSKTAIGVSGLLQIAMPVKDIERALRFYRDTLGLSFLFQAGQLAFFDLDGVRLMLDVVEDPGGEFDHPGSILYFRVPDVQAAHRALVERGVEIVSEPHVVHRTDSYELWMCFFRDGEQNVHAVAAEVPLG